MASKIIFAYFSLLLLCCLKLELALTATTTKREATALANGSEADADANVNLMHLILARILAEANATSNFVIAPQELLSMYLQLHGTEQELAAAAASTVVCDNDHVEKSELNTEICTNALNNEVDGVGDNSMREFEEFFNIAGSPILVTNTLYANVYTTKRFTRKLKNLQFVLHEDNDEDEDQNTGNSRNIDNNDATVARTSRTHNNTRSSHTKNDKRNELINAVRINSRWAHNFQKRDTHKRQFHMPLAHTHAYLHAMRKDDIFPYADLEELNARALELSLQRRQLKMLIMLPHVKTGLPQLLQRLSANVTLLDELCGLTPNTKELTGTDGNQHIRLESTLVRVFLPKFQFEQRTALDGIFRQLLNATANVDFHWPSAWQVTQEAQIAVSEDGIGELQPSMVLFWNAFSSLRTKPLVFCVDHPFLFIVYNRQGIQLLGHVAQLHSND